MRWPKTYEEWKELSENDPFWFQDENGVDLLQLKRNLELTPTQRVQKMSEFLKLVIEVRRAGRTSRIRKNTRTLAESGAEVILIGGLALIAHGGAHVTEDVDFAFIRNASNAQLIVDALREFDPRPEGFPPGLPFVWDKVSLMNSTVITLDTLLGRLDFLAQPDGAPPFRELQARAIQVEIFGTPVLVASLEDLAKMKAATPREKDARHLIEINALIKLAESSENS